MKKIFPVLTLLLLAVYGFAQHDEQPITPTAEAEEHDHEAEELIEEEHAHEADEHDHEMEALAENDEHDHTEHAEESLIEIEPELQKELGIQVGVAQGGEIVKMSTFPAEIKLNRDQTATVSARYASVVRTVSAEIGDEVKKGDVLAALENRETLASYTVTAPLDGVVIAKDLAVGETADAGKLLYQVADLGSVWADISIFPHYQHLIKKGMTVEFVAHDGHAASGTIKYISPIVSHETRTFTARSVLKGAGVDFTPGAFVRARIATQNSPVEVRVERAAVQMIEGESVLFVPEEHAFEARPVSVGVSNEQFIEIVEGLEPGDSYVATGAFALKAELMTSGMDPHAGHNH